MYPDEALVFESDFPGEYGSNQIVEVIDVSSICIRGVKYREIDTGKIWHTWLEFLKPLTPAAREMAALWGAK